MKELDRTSLIREPLYVQVRRLLLKRIHAGEWGPGDKIPAEAVLARELDVSSGTMRKAIEWLVADGVLERRIGFGTYLTSFRDSGFQNRFQPFASQNGERRFDRTKLVLFEYLRAEGRVADLLQLSHGALVIHLLRHHLKTRGVSGAGKERIVAADESFLNPKYFPDFTQSVFLASFGERDSLYKFYDRCFGVVITHQRCRLYLETLSLPEARRLGLPQAMSFMTAERISYGYGRSPIELRYNHMDPENFEVRFDLS